MYDLKDTVVLITGAAKGIGAAFVKILVQQGAKIGSAGAEITPDNLTNSQNLLFYNITIDLEKCSKDDILPWTYLNLNNTDGHVRILDIDEAAGVLLQNELNKKHGSNAVKFTKCDITNDKELFGAFKDTTDQYGYIDLVVNNAGVTNESNSDFVRKEIEVNFTALVNGTIKALELMRKDKGGRGGTVINVSSIAALIKHSPLLFVYAATKSAVLQFSNCVGKEPYYSNTGVRVITICYGPTNTGILDQMASFDEDIQMQELTALYPMQSTEVAAQGTLEAYRRGESGST